MAFQSAVGVSKSYQKKTKNKNLCNAGVWRLLGWGVYLLSVDFVVVFADLFNICSSCPAGVFGAQCQNVPSATQCTNNNPCVNTINCGLNGTQAVCYCDDGAFCFFLFHSDVHVHVLH